jgi:hypothetical protein
VLAGAEQIAAGLVGLVLARLFVVFRGRVAQFVIQESHFAGAVEVDGVPDLMVELSLAKMSSG